MKTMTKKLGAIILALAMCFSLTCVAFADDDYSITIENSIGEATYSAYKVFDAHYDGNGAVSYTIDSSSTWYPYIAGYETDVFTLTKTENEGTYHVAVAEGVSDEEVISAIKTAFAAISGSLTADATEAGNGGQIVLNINGPGYYYVTTSGAAVTITTAAPTATIMDKNTKPGTGGTDPKDPDWDGGFSKDAEQGSYSIGDIISYTIKSYVPTYDGDKVIGTYTITDTMGNGLTYDNDMTVKIIGSGLDDYEYITQFCTIELDKDSNTLTISWNPAVIEAAAGYNYPSDAVVTIEYTDTVNEAADEVDLTNSVSMQWTRLDPATGEPDPDDPDPGTTGGENKPEVTVYTYGFDLKKTDGENALEGAQFTLKSGEEEITFLYDSASDTYEVWDGTAAGETTGTITVADGEVNIWGLAAGTYTLAETMAPDGYNLLADPISIVITKVSNGWTVGVTEDGTTTTTVGAFVSAGAETDEHGVAVMPTVTVVNNAGSTLPGTGGMGTTIFYIIGGVLVAGAVVVLITRRRMRSES